MSHLCSSEVAAHHVVCACSDEALSLQLDKLRKIKPAADVSQKACNSGDSTDEASLNCGDLTCAPSSLLLVAPLCRHEAANGRAVYSDVAMLSAPPCLRCPYAIDGVLHAGRMST